MKKNIHETIIFGSDFFGCTKKNTIKTEKRNLYWGEVAELWRVTYFPQWAKKYPMWLNKILFWLFNNIKFLQRFEKYL